MNWNRNKQRRSFVTRVAATTFLWVCSSSAFAGCGGTRTRTSRSIQRRASSSSSFSLSASSSLEDWMERAQSKSDGALSVNNGAIVIRPSQILGPNMDCGNGLFCTRPMKRHERLFSVTQIITAHDAFDDEHVGSSLEALARSHRGWDTLALAGWMAKRRLCHSLLPTPTATNPSDNDDDNDNDIASSSLLIDLYWKSLPWSSDDQDHLLWWTQTDCERLLADSNIETEALGIRSDVAASTALLIDVLQPTVQAHLLQAFPTPEKLASLGFGTDDPDRICKLLLSNAIRGAFVILQSRSFDESLLSNEEGDYLYDDDDYGDHDDYDDHDDEGEIFDKRLGERLVPLFDIFQHATSSLSNVYHCFDEEEAEDGCIHVYAAKDLAEGEELVISYHNELDPQTFGLRFGFVPGKKESVRTLLETKHSIFFPNTRS